jgi:hypothetical protein
MFTIKKYIENNDRCQDAQRNDSREIRLMGKLLWVLLIKVDKMEDNPTAIQKWLKYKKSNTKLQM